MQAALSALVRSATMSSRLQESRRRIAEAASGSTAASRSWPEAARTRWPLVEIDPVQDLHAHLRLGRPVQSACAKDIPTSCRAPTPLLSHSAYPAAGRKPTTDQSISRATGSWRAIPTTGTLDAWRAVETTELLTRVRRVGSCVVCKVKRGPSEFPDQRSIRWPSRAYPTACPLGRGRNYFVLPRTT